MPVAARTRSTEGGENAALFSARVFHVKYREKSGRGEAPAQAARGRAAVTVLGGVKSCRDVALTDAVSGHGGMGLWSGWMILEAFSSLSGSVFSIQDMRCFGHSGNGFGSPRVGQRWAPSCGPALLRPLSADCCRAAPLLGKGSPAWPEPLTLEVGLGLKSCVWLLTGSAESPSPGTGCHAQLVGSFAFAGVEVAVSEPRMFSEVVCVGFRVSCCYPLFCSAWLKKQLSVLVCNMYEHLPSFVQLRNCYFHKLHGISCFSEAYRNARWHCRTRYVQLATPRARVPVLPSGGQRLRGKRFNNLC